MNIDLSAARYSPVTSNRIVRSWRLVVNWVYKVYSFPVQFNWYFQNLLVRIKLMNCMDIQTGIKIHRFRSHIIIFRYRSIEIGCLWHYDWKVRYHYYGIISFPHIRLQCKQPFGHCATSCTQSSYGFYIFHINHAHYDLIFLASLPDWPR